MTRTLLNTSTAVVDRILRRAFRSQPYKMIARRAAGATQVTRVESRAGLRRLDGRTGAIRLIDDVLPLATTHSICLTKSDTTVCHERLLYVSPLARDASEVAASVCDRRQAYARDILAGTVLRELPRSTTARPGADLKRCPVLSGQQCFAPPPPAPLCAASTLRTRRELHAGRMRL